MARKYTVRAPLPKPLRFYGLVAFVAFIPLAMYMLTYPWTYTSGPDQWGLQVLMAVALGAFLLAACYWMFKLGSRAAHMANPGDPEVTLRDIAKDQDELGHSH